MSTKSTFGANRWKPAEISLKMSLLRASLINVPICESCIYDMFLARCNGLVWRDAFTVTLSGVWHGSQATGCMPQTSHRAVNKTSHTAKLEAQGRHFDVVLVGRGSFSAAAY